MMREFFASARSNYDGVSGDSTGKEVVIQPYYDFNKQFGESYILRICNKELRHKNALYGKAICTNDMIGYSQADRYSLLEQLKKVGKIGNVTTRCNCDCSSMIGAIMYRAGYRDFNKWTSTRTLIVDFEKCMKAHKIKYKIIKFKKQSQLYKGDILLNEKSHVVVVL